MMQQAGAEQGYKMIVQSLKTAAWAATLSLCLLTGPTQAAMLFDTSPDAIGLGGGEFLVDNVFPTQYFATKFSLGGAHQLTGIDSYGLIGVNGAAVTVRIYNDTGSSIGSLHSAIGSTITLSDFSGDATNTYERHFAAFNQTLGAGSYWIGVSGDSISDDIGQLLLNSLSPATVVSFGGPFESILDQELAQASLRIYGDVVSEVPLPAALPLFASGLAGIGFLSWRRKRRTAQAAA